MQAVMLSIRPEWCALISSGKKTVEIRKTRPNIETPFKCYIYCTKAKNKEEKLILQSFGYELGGVESNLTYKANGKVIGEFVCDCIISHCEMANADIAEQQGCIKREQLFEYAKGKELYGWHISDLVIYDKPKELTEFFTPAKCPYLTANGCAYNYYCYRAGEKQKCGQIITRPFQSWGYVEERVS